MTTQFYARYIPPPVEQSSIEIPPPKRHKKTHIEQTGAVSIKSDGNITKKKKKRHKDRRTSPEPQKTQPLEHGTTNDHPHEKTSSRHHRSKKHEKIREKYEQSTKTEPAELLSTTVGDRDSSPSKTDLVLPTYKHGLEPLPQPQEAPQAPKPLMSSALPRWLAEPLVISQIDRFLFDHYDLQESIKRSLKEEGLIKSLPVQSAILPMLLSGTELYDGDLCIDSSTGSGKTLAYVLPMLQDLQRKPAIALRGLVILPTRELVAQTRELLETHSSGTRLRIGTAVGNKSLKEEQDSLIESYQKYDPEAYLAKRAQRYDLDEMSMTEDVFLEETGNESLELRYGHTLDRRSQIDILVCTPGRLVEHLQHTKGFTLKDVQWLVIDEVDRLLHESYQQWVDNVIPALEEQPHLDDRELQLSRTFHYQRTRRIRKILLSATMTRDISKLTGLKLRKPRLVVMRIGDVQQNGDQTESLAPQQLPELLDETALAVDSFSDKPLCLLELLEDTKYILTEPVLIESTVLSYREPDNSEAASSSESEDLDRYSPIEIDDNHRLPKTVSPLDKIDRSIEAALRSSFRSHRILIFTNNKEGALRLARLLTLLRPAWAQRIMTLTGSSGRESRKALKSFPAGKMSILIATDRAARGLNIKCLSHVINYDMPTSLASYTHRVGRTARAGSKGRATTLIAHHQAKWFWQDIGRAEGIRGLGKRVSRATWTSKIVTQERRTAYESALQMLGEEVHGK